MATKKEQQELIEILKFTPRTYTIQMWGYGGEKVMGRVDPKAWDYCIKNRVDLVDLAWSDDDTVRDDLGLDLDQLPFYPGQWYECDSMGHTHGVSRDAGTIQITDENGNTVFEKSLNDIIGGGCDGEPDWGCNDEVWVGQAKKDEVVFIGSSNEKGTFFEGELELRAPFDIEKLVLYYDEIDGEELVNSVYYNDEEIENFGGSTNGKSSDMNMVRIIDDKGNWQRYEAPEEDSEHPELVCTSEIQEDWDPAAELDKIVEEQLLTEWYPVDVKPTRKGEYEVDLGNLVAWPFARVVRAEWSGRSWKYSEGKSIKGIVGWRGLAVDPNELK